MGLVYRKFRLARGLATTQSELYLFLILTQFPRVNAESGKLKENSHKQHQQHINAPWLKPSRTRMNFHPQKLNQHAAVQQLTHLSTQPHNYPVLIAHS